MYMKFYKYQGAGNDFLIADNRSGAIREDGGVLYYKEDDGSEKSVVIADLCDRRYGVGADGVMLLETSSEHDFRMTYFNSDGSGGMMCGNGGRCIVAFAADRGIGKFDFMAADGFHTAEIISSEGGAKTVRLKMKNVDGIHRYESLTGPSFPSEGCFLDTGTRHYVRFVKNVDAYDVVAEGRDIRQNAQELLPVGANVNFVQPEDGILKVRTYEKGVEDETFACGTGIVASSIAAYAYGVLPSSTDATSGRVRYDIRAKRDALAVDFIPKQGDEFVDVWLTGPAAYVAEIYV